MGSRTFHALQAVLLLSGMLLAVRVAPAETDWALNGTVIEACSCPTFCPCYFNTQPAEHHDHGKFCRFNMAHKVNTGHWGELKLDGTKFWIGGDLGGDFSKLDADWGQLHFDPSVSPAQRDAIAYVVKKLYPYKWKAFGVGKDAAIEWQASEERAVARLDGGKGAEIQLQRNPTANGAGPSVVQNVAYEGAKRNTGFIIMPNEVEAYRLGPRAFEFKGTTGFVLTYDIASSDFAAAR